MSNDRTIRAVLSHAFWEIVVRLLGVLFAALVSFAAINWLGGWLHPLANHKWLASSILTTAILIISIRIYLRNTRFIPVFPRPECDFLILDKEISIRFFSLEDIRYRKKLTLKALRKGLDRYTDKYKWSGTGNVAVQSEHDEHRLELTHRSALWQWYDLYFDHALRKGETIDIGIVWSIEDKDRTAIPFISATVEEPTKSLTMRLFAKEFFGIRQATCEHKATMGSRKPFDTEILKALDGEIIWKIKRPKLLHYYEMHWTPHYQNDK